MTSVDMQKRLVSHLDEVLSEFETLMKRTPSIDEEAGFLARAAIHRVAGQPSVYVTQCEEAMNKPMHTDVRMYNLAGIAKALRTDIDAGYLKSQEELIHGELFADFLEMSQHLLDQKFKDAAAVIAGSSLEAHIRQLCKKSDIDIETSAGAPKKVDQINSDLAKASAYSKQDQKNVTAWLGLRNKAAHGEYDQYQATEVSLLIASIRDFITRNPA